MHIPVPPSRDGTSISYLYLLISRACPDRIKMGVTDSPAARVTSLQNVFGGFDLAASWLVQASSRREAVGLERTLQFMYGCALNWRAPAPGAAPVPGQSNGHQEWYRLQALGPMLDSIGHLIEHCGKREHLVLRRGVPAPETTPIQGVTREERRLLRRQRAEQLAREELAESAAGFRFIREWFAARSERRLSSSAPQEDSQGRLTREFTFRRAGVRNRELLSWGLGRGEWDELWAPGILRCHMVGNTQLLAAYLGRITFAGDGRTFTVGFALGQVFNSPADRFVPASLLPRQIREWVATA